MSWTDAFQSPVAGGGGGNILSERIFLVSALRSAGVSSANKRNGQPGGGGTYR